ncbi:uncharacterized protein LOC123321876 [Coccinella septempunctata]|uniref:uncharacterized protein LOC123321876 n=1 Tax=Coccinella septempunctata TaxID=41139 RepID=UPI001D07F506|nr:uncharacterized protein LOC123321876 [Coccinella septempunctata]
MKTLTRKNKFTISSSDTDIDVTSDHDDFDNLIDDDQILLDDFVLVRFPTKKNVFHCVGQVIELSDEYGEYVVKFLRHSKGYFKFPPAEDISAISRADIESKLPKPTATAATPRLASFLKFNINFYGLNLK